MSWCLVPPPSPGLDGWMLIEAEETFDVGPCPGHRIIQHSVHPWVAGVLLLILPQFDDGKNKLKVSG